MNKLVVATTIFVALCFVSYASAAGCTQQAFWDDFDYVRLVAKMKVQPDMDKVAILDQQTRTSTLGFNSTQVAGILFSTVLGSSTALGEMTNRNLVLGLVCSDVVTIFNTFVDSNDKLQMLSDLLPYTIDYQNNETVINAFKTSSDKSKASTLFANSNPYSCVWGTSNAATTTFIIDCSSSMATTFTDVEGQQVSRLQYAKQQLYLSLGSLKTTQRFNMIAFSDSATAWQPSVVSATADNIQLAYSWIASLTAGGSTFMMKAFQLAFSDSSVYGFNILSGGLPSDNAATLLNAVSYRHTNYPNPAVSTVIFQAGGTYSVNATALLKQIAVYGGGVTRSIV